MGTNTIRLSRDIGLGAKGVSEIPKPTFRKGKVVDTSPLTVNIGDDDAPVEVANSDANYVPALNDVVDLKVEDTEVSVIGMMGDALTVFRNLVQGADANSAPRSAITYGNLASPGVAGPACTVEISSSGRAIAVITCKISATSDNDGGAVGVALSGANTVAATDAKSLQFEGNVVNSLSRASAFLYYQGLTPGSTTFTMQYKDLLDTGSDVDYALREIVVLPL